MKRFADWFATGSRRVWVPVVAAAALGVALAGGGDSPEPVGLAGVDSTTTSSTDPTPTTSTVATSSSSTSATTTTTSPTAASTATTTTLPGPTTTAVALPVGLFSPPERGASGDPNAAPPSGSQSAVVVSITDGDTIRVSVGGSNERLRIIGINSPESGECFAREADRALSAMLPQGTEVHLTRDRSDRDQYDRLLRYVWVGGFNVGEEMVRRGAAIAREYPPDVALAERLARAQDEARDGGRGLWAADACGAPTGFRVEVVELHADAPGNDHENLNGEYVVIRNRGGSPADLTGWVLKDESASHRYSFPSGFTLGAGAGVTVFTGCGADTAEYLYWCSRRGAVWNNDGDTAFLLDPNGNLVHSLSSR